MVARVSDRKLPSSAERTIRLFKNFQLFDQNCIRLEYSGLKNLNKLLVLFWIASAWKFKGTAKMQYCSVAKLKFIEGKKNSTVNGKKKRNLLKNLYFTSTQIGSISASAFFFLFFLASVERKKLSRFSF